MIVTYFTNTILNNIITNTITNGLLMIQLYNESFISPVIFVIIKLFKNIKYATFKVLIERMLYRLFEVVICSL